MNAERQIIVTAGQTAYASSRFEEALQYFLRATQSNPPGSVEFFDMVGHCYSALSRSKEAIPLYKAFVEQNPESILVWSNLAVATFNNQEFQYSAHAMGEAIRLNGPNRETLLLRFLALYYGGEDDKIQELMTQYVELNLGEFESVKKMLEYVESSPDQTRRDTAMEMYYRAGKQHMGVTLNISFFFQKCGKPERAAELIEEFLQSKIRILQPELVEAYIQLCQLLLARNDVEGATRQLQKGIGRVRAMNIAYRLARWLGWAHARNGDPHLAGDFYRASAEFDPEIRYPLIRTSFSL